MNKNFNQRNLIYGKINMANELIRRFVEIGRELTQNIFRDPNYRVEEETCVWF